MKQYWLVLDPGTFLWVKGSKACAYSTIQHRIMRFSVTKKLNALVTDLLQIDNLYRTMLTDKDLSDFEIHGWVKELLSLGCAKLIPITKENKEVAVSLMPMLKVQDNLSYYKYTHNRQTDGCIMSNLHKLVVHLNGAQLGNNNWARQILFPKSLGVCDLDRASFFRFLYSMGYPHSLSEIVLVGCIWEYAEKKQLLEQLCELSTPISICCLERDFVTYMRRDLKSIYSKFSFYILINNYISDNRLIKDPQICYYFILSSEEDYEAVETLIVQYCLENYRLIPICTGKNLTFFENCIYLSEEELLNINLSKREIFAHQVINTNYFGVLTIAPDGKVYSGDMNEPAIGTIDESLYTIVYREMTEGHSWLRIRDQKPCCDCIYQWLCPSPSNYELAIGKPNLCHVKP